jgi:hypothetical protein
VYKESKDVTSLEKYMLNWWEVGRLLTPCSVPKREKSNLSFGEGKVTPASSHLYKESEDVTTG